MERFPNPPALGMTAGLIGKGLVIAAIVAFLLSIVFWLRKNEKVGSRLFFLGASLVVAVFGVHVALLLSQQYQYQYVFQNTERDMPGAYRFSAAWAAQEGSFLLWTLTSAFIAAIVARWTGVNRRVFSIVAGVAICAMLAIVAYESPFKLVVLTAADKALLAPGQTMLMPPNGNGMNPTLMNYWMAIHPWVIFTGFGSLLSLFSWAAASSWRRELTSWVAPIRPLAIFSSIVQRVGLTMGGLWAYETLGWGGFWAWDPVENVSLVPFVAATVFLHGLYIQGARGSWSKANVLFGLLPFAWFIYGTYLTRSGALVKVSVHSFAEMNAGAHGILLGMVIATGVALAFFSFRAFSAADVEQRSIGTRQAGLSLGVLLLYAVGIMAAVGMSVPFFGAVLGRQQEVVSEGLYNKIVAWPFVPALVAMAVVPFLGWTKTAKERWNLLSNLTFASVLILGGITFALVKSGLTLDNFERMPALQLIIFLSLIFVCVFGIVANSVRTFERLKAKAGGVGPFVTHMGVCLLLLGLIVSRAFEKTQVTEVTTTLPGRLALAPGQAYLATLDKMPSPEGLLKPDNELQFTLINDNGGKKTSVSPNYYYSVRTGEPQLMSRPEIVRSPLYDLYFIAGAPQTEVTQEFTLKRGETKSIGDLTVKYVDKYRVGEPGMKGTRFGTHLEVTVRGEKHNAHPEIKIGDGGMEKKRASVAGVAFDLLGLQATDGTATLQLVTPDFVVPVQLYFKPLTSLVWLGAGMMTLGGFLSILKRRKHATPQPSEI